jgi:hypothetical protein
MYLTHTKAALTEALRATFDADYPQTDFRNILVSIEYPIKQIDYPSIYVEFDESDQLAIAGINYIEITRTPDAVTKATRWRFYGTATLTCVALSSLERDRLYDEVVRAFAFGKQNPALSPFRNRIESNDLVAINANFDNLRATGDAAAPGTPWGTDEVIYERSASFQLQGEFVGDPDTSEIVPLSQIVVQDYVSGLQNEPVWPDGPFPAQSSEQADPFSWR